MSEQIVGTSDCSCHSRSIHWIDRQQLLVSLLEGDTPNRCVVTFVEFYHTYYKSNQPKMPAARDNGATWGRAKEGSPLRQKTAPVEQDLRMSAAVERVEHLMNEAPALAHVNRGNRGVPLFVRVCTQECP